MFFASNPRNLIYTTHFCILARHVCSQKKQRFWIDTCAAKPYTPPKLLRSSTPEQPKCTFHLDRRVCSQNIQNNIHHLKPTNGNLTFGVYALVSFRVGMGVGGDKQAQTQTHVRSLQPLCLWSRAWRPLPRRTLLLLRGNATGAG